MEAVDYWRLCDDLTIDDAVNLIVGMIPKQNEICSNYGADLIHKDAMMYEMEYNACINALIQAISNKKLKAKIININPIPAPKPIYDSMDRLVDDYSDWEEIDYAIDNIDVYKTMIAVDDLKTWLISKNLKPEFFFGKSEDEPDYLDENNEFYAPKLATAIKAWQAVTKDKSLLKNKSPKQAVEAWLKINAKEFGLIDNEGNHIKQAIEEISKIVNWKPKGGATKTPTNENNFTDSEDNSNIPF